MAMLILTYPATAIFIIRNFLYSQKVGQDYQVIEPFL